MSAGINATFYTEYWEDNFCLCLLSDGEIKKEIYLPNYLAQKSTIINVLGINYWILSCDLPQRMVFTKDSWLLNLTGLKDSISLPLFKDYYGKSKNT